MEGRAVGQGQPYDAGIGWLQVDPGPPALVAKRLSLRQARRSRARRRAWLG